MKSLLIALIMVIVFSVPAFADDSEIAFEYVYPEPIFAPLPEWSSNDTAMQTTFSVLLLADYSMTVNALSNGATEQNPIVGANPSSETLALYTGACMYLNYWVSRKIDSKFWRFIWQATSISLELYCIDNNLNAN